MRLHPQLWEKYGGLQTLSVLFRLQIFDHQISRLASEPNELHPDPYGILFAELDDSPKGLLLIETNVEIPVSVRIQPKVSLNYKFVSLGKLAQEECCKFVNFRRLREPSLEGNYRVSIVTIQVPPRKQLPALQLVGN
jgi:hypothetical protein